MIGEEPIRDRRGYNFDGCSPGQLLTAGVLNNQVVFPGGAAYNLLVLPAVKTMTPALAEKIKLLVYEGATVVGSPPEKSPGLSGFPGCDEQVKTTAQTIWGASSIPYNLTMHRYGKGKIIWGGIINSNLEGLYPAYDVTAKLFGEMGIAEDFTLMGSVRYTHRKMADQDIYFVSNKTSQLLKTNCTFKSDKGTAELWNAITGEIRTLPEFVVNNGQTSIPL